MKANKILGLILTFAGMVIIFSCKHDDMLKNLEPLGGEHSCKNIIIDESQYDTAPRDDFMIKDAIIKNDSIILMVQYSGGCGAISFELITEGYFMESNPVQLDILLSFEDEDPCEAAIQEQICFDMTKLAKLYKDSYLANQGTIILRLQGYADNLEYIF